MRKQIAAANWKMNCTLQQANDLIDGLIERKYFVNPDREVVLAVPFPYLMMAKEKLKNLTALKWLHKIAIPKRRAPLPVK